MSAEEFYRSIVDRLDRKPFRTFVVELNDGRKYEIDRRSLAIRGGFAGGFARGNQIIRLDCENVKQIFDVPVSTTASQEA